MAGQWGRPAPPSAAAPGVGRLTTNDALSYLRDVKQKFSDNKDIYDTFLEIMKEFKAQRINTEGVIERVKDLFRGHRELILGFNTFLPKGYEIDMPEEDEEKPKAVEFDQAINYVNKIKTRFSSDERVYKAFLEILNMYRKGQKTIGNVYEEVALLFRNQRDLLEEFTYFLPDSTAPQQQPTAMQRPRVGPRVKMASGRGLRDPGDHMYRSLKHDDDDRRLHQKGHMSRELAFFEKVKQRIRNREQYQDLLKFLNLFAQDIITKAELQAVVHDILARFPDLLVAFQDFINSCEQLDFEYDGKVGGHARGRMKGEKFTSRPISELDVSNWERCTTSYVKLPANYPRMQCSGRAGVPASIFNDVWVSVTSGSEDYSFKHMRKNQYEEALFRCEDDRFELDMAIECNASAIRAIEPLVEGLASMDAEERAAWRLPEKALSPIHLRAIARIYGESGANLVELVKKNPAVALNVVIGRLRQKDREWRRVKANMTKLWQKVYEANYHKSLDHRSFYFKQTDKKFLGAKAMLLEIKEANDKRRREEAGHPAAVSMPLASTSGRQGPDLVYSCYDVAVHNDVYSIIKYALEEILTTEQAERALDMWVTVMEPLFGLPKRSAPSMGAGGENASVGPDGRSGASPKARGGNLARGASLRMAAMSGELGGGDSEGDAPSGMDNAMDADAETTEVCDSAALLRADPDEALSSGGDGAGLPHDRSTGIEHLQRAAGLELMGGADVPAGRGPRRDQGGDEDMGEIVEEVAGPEHDHIGGAARATGGDSETAEEDEYAEHQRGQGGGETDGEGDASTEGAGPPRDYAGAKPLAPADAARAAEGPGSGVHGRTLYGNDILYIFFRLHQYLYDRLRQARKCAAAKVQPMFRGNGDFDAHPGEELPELEGEAAAAHAQFMQYVFDLVDGTHDSSAYEDATRALLGTNSYVLFTLDKLIYKAVKQMQALLADDLSMKLADLYKYEVARSPERYSGAVYLANAHVLLHDDPAFQFETARPAGQFAITMLGTDRSEVLAAVMDPGFGTYLATFTDAPVSLREVVGRRRQPFLRRSLAPEVLVADDATLDERTIEALRGAEVTNGLECKISCTTSKVSYVLDTEDIFRRIKRRRTVTMQAPAPAPRLRFAEWLADRKATVEGCLPQPMVA